MQNMVPHFILEKHAAGERQGHFAAVSLFADISGFSAVTHALMARGSEAAEAMADVMRNVFTPLVDAIYAQGGFVSTFAGDAFTAVFPQADGAYHRALAATAAIQQHMIAHPVQTTSYGKFPFSVKLGLGDGEVLWGILTPQESGEAAAYYFSGSAIEAASQAEHYAQPGNLILSPNVQVCVGDVVKSLPAGEEAHTRLLRVEGELPAPFALAEPVTLPGQATFVPPAVLELQGQGEFRQVVSVFVNLMGVERDEDLSTFMDAVFDLREQHGGYLARVDFGDKGCNLLLFWGAPRSTENDVERALDFVYELGDYTPGTYKAGVTYRPMYAGMAGSARRGEYTTYGDGINYAARLMVAAPWGRIWLDERVAHRATGRYMIEAQGKHPFKGFDEPQPVFALVERQALTATDFYQGELVGRTAELAQLERFVQPLAAQDEGPRFAGILSVEGEAGMGKSRLVMEFLHRWSTEPPGGQWFLCQTDQTVRQPLNPFRYWLHHYFEQSATQSEARNKRAFSRRLDQLITALAQLPGEDAPNLASDLNHGRSFLGALVGLYWPNSPYAQLDAQGRHEWTLTALKSLLLAESLCQPAILNLEDAHWLDAESVEFVQRLVRQVDAYPLAILATARPTIGDKPLFGEAAYQRLDLVLMREAELVQLGVNLLGGALSDDLSRLLSERAEGNPFFAEQILLYVQEEGGIEQVDGTWQRAGARTQEAPLPTDVRTIFAARLDRLTQQVKDIVQTAAILGREFEVRVLAQMLHEDQTLPEVLVAAEQAAIWSAIGQMRYLFKHGLLRNAAYEMQLRARRRELHQLAAQAILSLYQDNLAEYYDELGYHYEAAYRQGLNVVYEQAITYLRLAGEQAAASYENEAAVDYFSRALALIPEAERERRFDLLRAREEVYSLRGARQAQEVDVAALEELANQLHVPARQSTAALRQA
jgi:class 3 adenylate cyclase